MTQNYIVFIIKINIILVFNHLKKIDEYELKLNMFEDPNFSKLKKKKKTLDLNI